MFKESLSKDNEKNKRQEKGNDDESPGSRRSDVVHISMNGHSLALLSTALQVIYF